MPGWFSENTPPRPPLGAPCLFQRGNVHLRYFRSGQGPQVLLLPGLARSPSDFNELVEFLCARGFQTLALEGRGVGASRAPLRPRATLSDLAADVAAVAGDNGGRVHVIGRGLGGRVARTFAAEYPQMALSVVLIASGGKHAPPRRGQLAWDAFVFSNLLLPRRWRWAAGDRLMCAPGHRLPDFMRYGLSLRALALQGPAARRAMSLKHWQGGNARILCIHGEQDRVAPLTNALELRDAFPDRVQLATIAQAGHNVFFEHSETVCALIGAFLEQISTGQPRGPCLAPGDSTPFTVQP